MSFKGEKLKGVVGAAHLLWRENTKNSQCVLQEFVTFCRTVTQSKIISKPYLLSLYVFLSLQKAILGDCSLTDHFVTDERKSSQTAHGSCAEAKERQEGFQTSFRLF